MARITGNDGAITLGGIGTVFLRTWSIDYNTVAVNVTAFGDAAQKRAPGIKDWTFTAEGVLDGTTGPDMPTTTVTGTFTAATGKEWVGTCVVTRISPTINKLSDAGVRITGEGDGDLTTTSW